MRRRAPPLDPKLRHAIVPGTNGGFELRTHLGYVLNAFATIEEARAYYAWHCPGDYA